MLVRAVRESVAEGVRETAAEVVFHGEGDRALRIWFRRPDAGPLPAPGDPFLAALLPFALALHEDLRVDAPVSVPLLAAARERLMPTLVAFLPRLRAVAVEAEAVEEVPARSDASVAVLFSGGVDSWHALLAREHEVDALVHIRGFEILNRDEASWAGAHAAVLAVGRERRKRVLPVAMNLGDDLIGPVRDRLARRGRPWRAIGVQAWFGSLLVGIGRTLVPGVSHLVVPSSWKADPARLDGSHPLVEPAWSTPLLGLTIDASDRTRIEKIRALASDHPDVLPRLRVCIDTAGRRADGRNCGRCLKCVRLMLELRVAGVPADRGPFPDPMPLRRMRLKRLGGDPVLWREIADAAAARGDAEVVRTVRVMNDQRLHLPRLFRDVRRAVRRRSLAEIHWPGRPRVR